MQVALQLCSADKMASALQSIDSAVATVWESAPANTLIVLAALGGNTAHARYAYEAKCKRQGGLPGLPPWSLRCEEELAAITEAAAQGCLWLAVK